jgi:hypothetical protein
LPDCDPYLWTEDASNSPEIVCLVLDPFGIIEPRKLSVGAHLQSVPLSVFPRLYLVTTS